jgi:hypothetical protein
LRIFQRQQVPDAFDDAVFFIIGGGDNGNGLGQGRQEYFFHPDIFRSMPVAGNPKKTQSHEENIKPVEEEKIDQHQVGKNVKEDTQKADHGFICSQER